MKKFLAIAGGVIAVFVLLLAGGVIVAMNPAAFASVPVPVKSENFKTFCLKGKTVIKLGNDAAYLYDLDAEGKPVACKM